MQYNSTRNYNIKVNGAEAIVAGLSSDGGLFVPMSIPTLDLDLMLNMSACEMSSAILSAMFPELDNMSELVNNAYTGKFAKEDLTPTVLAGEFSVLELYHGPTSAFKDVALCVLPWLLTSAKKQLGLDEDTLILTATSGDTGKAALEGFKNVPGIKICVFYPDGGVSAIQKAQMIKSEGNNLAVCAVRGNFDDAQTGVKNIFSSYSDGKIGKWHLSSANSINIGRLAPQIMYYFKSYKDSCDRGIVRCGDKVNFAVPTGNFGDILAGWLAGQMGLPVGKLICASNKNNVLTDFIKTGKYNSNRPLYKTTSPSMDILVSSNLERLLYLLSGDDNLVASMMDSLKNDGSYTIPDRLLQKIQTEFYAGYCDDNMTAETINKVWCDKHYLIDPHTACAYKVAEEYKEKTGDDSHTIVLSTASPYKFPAAVISALGEDTAEDEYELIKKLNKLTDVPIPKNLMNLKDKPDIYLDVIDKSYMSEYVKELQ